MVKPIDSTPRPVPTPATNPPESEGNLLATKALGTINADGKGPNGLVDKLMGVAEKIDGFIESHPKETQFVSSIWNGLGNHVAHSPVPGHQQVANIFGWGQSDVDKLSDDTKGLRDTANQLASVKGQLSKLPPNDPKRPALEQQAAQLTNTLSSKYGYANGKTPAPGTLWVDPEFCGKELPNDQVTGSHFPAGTPVTQPPSALDAMFAGGKSYSLTTADGKVQTFHSAAEYQAYLAQNRTAQGMPRTDGNPVGVQMNFEGGGGKGKRYGPALSEMASVGVIPTSCTGSSAGAIAAMLVAAGADAAEVNRFCTDPKLASLFDIDIGNMHGGLADGKAAYDMFDQELRKLTGVKDRPVTFADLKIPLQICATKMSDSAGIANGSDINNRLFVFSQQNTPNTPVALAVRASMAIPGAFDPVDVLDPMTGRQLKLVDGGVIDNLPMHESPNYGLPTVGLKLTPADDDNPDNHTHTGSDKLRGGNLNVDNVILNAFYGKEMNDASHTTDTDYWDTVKPKAGQFMLGIPTFDLNDTSKGDSTLGFGYDPKVDPVLDQQTRQVTRDFFKQVLGQLTDPAASGTNIKTNVGQSFSTAVKVGNSSYVASYSGGDSVTFKQQGGNDSFSLKLGANKIKSMMIDGASFGDLAAQLAQAAQDGGHKGAAVAALQQSAVRSERA